ncbi:MAG: TolC family outer membrane protein [Cytophagales bacterium]|nr:TolC family outer membrane protein [Cytophagales bacterium]
MKRFSLSTLATALALGLAAGTASGQSLTALYESARSYDAPFLSAKAQFDASVALADQTKAALLPTIGFSGTVSRTDYNLKYPYLPSVGTNNVPQERFFGNRTYGINVSQPLYRPGNLASYNQGQKQLLLADAQLQAAEQDLIIRLSQAYFDVLASKDSLTLVKAQKAAVAEQLASAKRNFEVGTSTITDTNEAQARFDLARAQEIAAENDVRVKQLALRTLVGKSHVEPLSIRSGAALPTLKGDDMTQWVDAAQEAHPSVRSAQIAVDVAMLENDKSRAGHKPTVDGFINLNNSSNLQGTNVNNSTTDSRSFSAQAGITLNIPLFAGFATQNRLKQTLALEEKARNDLDNAKRVVAQATRTAYLGVESGLGSVKAYEAAEKSSQSALDSNKLGYQVGVRINIDVLNAQSQLYQTKRDLAVARYNVLLGQLKLRQANGTLKDGDLALIDGLLAK